MLTYCISVLYTSLQVLDVLDVLDVHAVHHIFPVHLRIYVASLANACDVHVEA